jgi:hypothetical protein
MDFPPAYSMCFEEECRERQAQNQVSEWEATQETFALLPNKRILHPHLAVAKYRRSAAGDVRRRPPRNLVQLETTWKHLLYIFTHQTIHDKMSPRSLRSTVSFVDDRVRAMQVDLVLSQQASASLQVELIKYQLLCCYLLSDMPRKDYEPKFARQALWTALTAYWNDVDREYDDEVLCYTALCQLAMSLMQQEGWQDTGSYGNILLLAQHCEIGCDYPKFQYALEIVSAAMLGFYRNVLSMLKMSGNENFHVTCRCCVAPALNAIRLGALEHYNKAFGKLEKISGQEVRVGHVVLLYVLDS